MDLQPGDRFVEDGAVEQAAMGALRRLQVEQARLQRDDLLQPLDVAPRDRQHAELDPALERVGRKAAPADQAERVEQRAGQYRVGQRLRRAFEPRAVAVDGGDRPPERIAGRGELRRDLLQQPGGSQLPECFLAVARSEDLVELFDQPRR